MDKKHYFRRAEGNVSKVVRKGWKAVVCFEREVCFHENYSENTKGDACLPCFISKFLTYCVLYCPLQDYAILQQFITKD